MPFVAQNQKLMRGEPSPTTRTAVFVAMAGPVTTIKALIFERLLCTSPFDVVVGVDTGQTNATSSSVLSLIRAAQQRTNTNVTQVVPMSNALLERRHTTKISHFAGGGSGGSKGPDSPAKLAVLDWLADARYKYMWHLEDDAWSADFGLFASRYASSTADLIIHNESGLPFWAEWARNCTRRDPWDPCRNRTGWKIGSLHHVLPEGTFSFASLAAYRASRAFARAVLHTIAREEHATTHHELYFPYVISLYPRLVWESLRPGHQTLFSKGTSNVTKFKPLCALRRAEMYHPVKRQCAAALEGYSLCNLACADCPHPANDVANWRTCRQLCNRWRPLSSTGDNCTGWVYNSNSQCYLKRGVRLYWRREGEAHAWGGTSWSGPATRMSPLGKFQI